jgi:hypothetical protein
MVAGARGAACGHGVDGAVLEAGAGRTVSALAGTSTVEPRPRGRQTDFRDAKRSVSRLLSDDLILSYVPNMEQRGWRALTCTKYQLTRDRVRLQSQLESLLEECRIKLSSVINDLPGSL